jgi:hypothetical protein
MSLNVLILFDEADRALAESLRSLLWENRVHAHLATDLHELRPAGLALAILSPAGADSTRFRDLLEVANQDGLDILVLRLDQTPIPAWYRFLDTRPDPSFFEGSSQPDRRFLQRLVESLRRHLRPTRSPNPGVYRIPDDDIAPPKVPTSYDSTAKEEAPLPKPPGAYSFDPVDRLPETEPPVREAVTRTEEPPEAAPAAGLPSPENVHFSAYAPPAVTPGMRFLLSIWAYLEKDRKKARKRASQGGRYREAGYKAPVKLTRGSEVTVYLEIPGFEVASPADTLAWEGEIGNCSFTVGAPEGLATGRYPGTALLLVAGVQVGRLGFELEVGAQARGEAELQATLERVRTMFASYSTEDRIEVLRFKQGAEAAGVDVFVDVLSMRTGEDWAQRLEREVTSRDRFCLFWSKNASRSEWVEKEWRAAYSAKGVSYIHPVPLADPRDVPPPPELGNCKHFNDVSQIVIAYEQQRRQAGL